MKPNIHISFILLFACTILYAQKDDITFRRVSPPGGYSIQAISCFAQDQHGYIWMAGFNGVIRYNSKEITRFIHNPENFDGLPSNKVTEIVVDNNNKVWVSTVKGLCVFNPEQQRFDRVEYKYEDGSKSNDNLFSIQVDGFNRLWVVDENYFGYLDEENKRLIRITDGLSDSPRLLYKDQGNRLWLGTEEGAVYQVLIQDKKASKLIDGLGSLVRTIASSHNEIWVGYQQHGARKYNFNGKLLKHYKYSSDPEFNLESTSVRKIWRDTRGRIWIGSYLGLYMSDGNTLVHLDHDNYEGLPHNSIFDLFEDQQGGLWIGTWSGGVAYIHHSDNTFTNYRHSELPGTISDNMVSSFAQTPEGEIYVGTELFGLNTFNIQNSTFKQHNIINSKKVIDIKALSIDLKGGLWVATAFNGILYRPHKQTEFINFSEGEEDGKHVSSKETYALCPSDSGMWIGTIKDGINFYNFNTGKITFESNERPYKELLGSNITSIKKDKNKNLWLTTSDGFYKVHLPTKKLTRFSTASIAKHRTHRQSFYTCAELSDGNIWIGTEGDGINIYHPKGDSISYFNANGLLKSKDVYGIIEDHNNNIWITSNNGLILYDRIDNTSRRFIISDGIQGNLFNINAIFKDKSNNLYFGGTNGFSFLEPKSIKTNKRPPNVLLNKITVNNHVIIPKPKKRNEFEHIVLKPDETTFTFSYSADNYLFPEKNEFVYRLTNYVNDWVYDANKGSASFVNVPAGDYTFEVRASNNDGVWNHKPSIIKVTIKQFWYRSNTALTLYLLIILLIGFFIFRFYKERLKLKKQLLIEKIQHEQDDELNNMKLKFFTNISHEFRTPLTLINGPVTSLLKSNNLSSDEYKQLDTIRRNTNRLLQLINQLMDLRKKEKTMSKLNISKVDLLSFINERLLNFSMEAKRKHIELSFNHDKKEFPIEVDEEKLDKIIYNLLSNAFKFTPDKGKISVSIQLDESSSQNNYSNQLSFGKCETKNIVRILISDTGPGIESQEMPNIFERFEQGSKGTQKIDSTGIGLNLCKDYTIMHRGVIVVQSTPGEGTCFTVQLPVKQKAQKILHKSHEKVKNINSWESIEKEDIKSNPADKNINILVVEDNKDLQQYIVNLLQDYYSVISADNGKQGLEVLNNTNINLVISDVMMPEMDGFEFCKRIKSQIEISHIPVILLTALSSAENTSTGLGKGADAYISKPFDENILLSQINNLIIQRKRLQESYSKKFLTQQPIDVGSLDNFFLNKINKIIEDNIENENLSVDMIANEMGFSRSQLYRKTKQISNLTTSEYINMVKVKKATALLTSKNYTIDEVAFKSGFNSHSYFSKCFKKIHKQSPKEFLISLD